MDDKEYIELRSEEVQEILGTPPSWLVRWGSFVIFFGLVAMIVVSSLVRYPDVVSGRIEITTAVPPVDVVAQADGYLEELFVKDNTLVKPDEVLGLLESTSRYQDVLRLEGLLSRWMRTPTDSLQYIQPPTNLFLGDLQAEYAALARQFDQLAQRKRSAGTDIRRSESAAAAQISRLKQAIANDRRAADRKRDQIDAARELYNNQKKLFNDGIISRMDLERERARVTELERELNALEDNIFQKENEIIVLEKNVGEVRNDAQDVQADNSSGILASMEALRGSIARWKNIYLLKAPIGGQVSLNNAFFGKRQFVRSGDVVLTIVPPSSDTLFGRMALPISGSGKVSPKLRVIVKLDNYPYHEYGTVEGRVYSKSLVPRDNNYLVQVLLINGLETSYGRKLTFQQQLQGDAEIVTDVKSFLQRVTDQVFAGRSRRIGE